MRAMKVLLFFLYGLLWASTLHAETEAASPSKDQTSPPSVEVAPRPAYNLIERIPAEELEFRMHCPGGWQLFCDVREVCDARGCVKTSTCYCGPV